MPKNILAQRTAFKVSSESDSETEKCERCQECWGAQDAEVAKEYKGQREKKLYTSMKELCFNKC